MRKILKFVQIGLDFGLVLGAFVLAYFVRVKFVFSTDFPFGQYFPVAIVVSVLTVVFAFLIKTYRDDQKVLSVHHFLRTGFSSILQVALFAIIFYFFYQSLFSRLMLVYIAVFSLVLVYGGHVVFDKSVRFLHSKGKGGVVRTLLIGTNREAQKIVRLLQEQRSQNYIVAILDGYGSSLKEIEGIPVKGKLNKLEEVVKADKIEQIIQVDNLEQAMNLLNFAKQNGLKYVLTPSTLGAYHQDLESVNLGDEYPVLRVAAN